jgi:hypothetical protein
LKDFAVIWTTDKGYYPGTNASLNAFEYYKNSADIYVLTWGNFLSDEYKRQWNDVTFIEIETTVYPGRNSGWYFRFMDFDYAVKYLFNKYSAVLFWSADQCFLNNIMQYFYICANGFIILGTNEHGTHTRNFNRLSKERPYKHTWDVPYTDQPIFVPSSNHDLIKAVLEQQKNGESLSRMDGLNYAVRDLNFDIFEVPGELWIQNVPYKIPLKEHEKSIYFYGSSTKLNAFHRRYWNKIICNNYLPGTDETSKQISKANKILFNRMYNFFNTECRVKWDEGIDIWTGNSHL